MTNSTDEQAPNEAFREYATSTAFSISLSKRQCNELLAFSEGEDTYYSMSSLRALEARGFIAWNIDEKGQKCGVALTWAGELMVGLLREAGLTRQNTLTLQSKKWEMRKRA